MAIKLADFWEKILTPVNAGNNVSKNNRKLEQKVLDLILKRIPAIYSGDVDAKLTVSEQISLIRELKEYNKFKYTRQYIYQLNFLVKGLEKGKKEFNWENVVIPETMLAVPREPARFTPLSFLKLNKLKVVTNVFIDKLAEEPSSNPLEHIGIIMLSAVLFGGMLDKKWLTALLRALPHKVRMHGSIMWIEMEYVYNYPKLVTEQEYRKTVHRRWFPDPLTQALIIRLHEQFPNLLSECAKLDGRVYLDSAIRMLFPDIKSRPTTPDVLGGAATWLAVRIPSFLVSYATGKVPSVSLPEHAWTRIYTGCKVTSPTSDPIVVEDDDQFGTSRKFLKDNTSDSIRLDSQARLQEKLISLMSAARTNRLTSRSARDQVQNFVVEHSGNLVPVMHMVCQWAVELLSRLNTPVVGRKHKVALQPSSVLKYLQLISSRLVTCAGKDNITLYEPEELEELYAEIVKSGSTFKLRQDISQKLMLFHHFIKRFYGAAKIDIADFSVKKGPPELGVDANFVSPRMITIALQSLGWGKSDLTRLQEITCLITILGFKCGLRRREVLCLRIGDLMGRTCPEIVVRTNRLFRPKTADSMRRIPIYLLLEEKELEALLALREQRIAETGANYLDASLFGYSGCIKHVDENDVFPVIMDVIRNISGDMTLCFHHLRHSNVNWLLFGLISSEIKFDTELPGLIEEPTLAQKEPYLVSRGLFGNLCHGRQFLYGVSSMHGHADPSTTMLHYVHLADFILGQSVRQYHAQPVLTLQAIMQLTGLKRAMIFRSKSDAQSVDWVMGAYICRLSHHARKIFPDPLASTASKPKIGNYFQEYVNPKCLPRWQTIAHVLKLHFEDAMESSEIARRLAITVEEVEAWCRSACTIRDLRMSDGKTKSGELRLGKPRHVTRWKNATESDNATMVFPTRIIYPYDRNIVDKIFRTTSLLSGEDLEIVREGVATFINNFSIHRGFIRLTALEDAIRYRHFLKIIGVPKSFIHISMFAETSAPSKKDLTFQRKIMNELDIAADNFFSSGRRHIAGRNECSVAFIIAQKQRKAKRHINEINQLNLYGFRYSMYLIAISLGINS